MTPSAKYDHKIVKRIRFRIPDQPGALGRLATELGRQGAVLGNITIISITTHFVIRDIVVFFDSTEEFRSVVLSVRRMKGYRIETVSDVVLDLHKGGKIAVAPRVSVETLSDLRMVYTPGVAQVCRYLVEHPEDVRRYTSIGNTVCIATNGSAILGLGDIGVLAGMPVMEGKSLILHKMAGVSCVPILIDSPVAGPMVEALASIAKTFSLIMIEDVRAPVCFEVEQKLQERVDVPVFHDDQHGTATVVLGALLKALRMTGRKIGGTRVVVNGAGAAGHAICRLLLEYGLRDVVACDRQGILGRHRIREMDPFKAGLARATNPRGLQGTLAQAVEEADVFIGVSAPGMLTPAMVGSMRRKPIVFAMANPVPEIWPKDALEAGAAVALDGRTINNALIFPGLVRGALDAAARRVTTQMKIRAAETLLSLAGKTEVVPNFMNPVVHRKIAAAVKKASGASGC